ncbi:MAG TPA: methyltransferase domain-containing protein [Opitutaceae bacterium]|nr:methyltransferase domain-containing protein [Opitutaceae bacterium]
MAYTGFDICAGENVDVVGDAHELSHYFPEECFDFAFSVSVWEHLAMPWKVSLELNRILKTGGVAMINSHQCWPSHEEPWDYYRFSEYSWSTLFNPYTGFEILTCGQGFPGIVVPGVIHSTINNLEWHYGYLASRGVVRKTARTTLSWEVPTHAVASGDYPK